MTRCKPGELAVYEGPKEWARGIIVKIAAPVADVSKLRGTLECAHYWWAKPAMRHPDTQGQIAWPDVHMRPIRPERDPSAIDTPADVGEVAWG